MWSTPPERPLPLRKIPFDHFEVEWEPAAAVYPHRRLDLWKYALRNGDSRAVVLLLLMASYLRDGAGPPHRPWGPPRGARGQSRRAVHASLTGRRPRG